MYASFLTANNLSYAHTRNCNIFQQSLHYEHRNNCLVRLQWQIDYLLAITRLQPLINSSTFGFKVSK